MRIRANRYRRRHRGRFFPDGWSLFVLWSASVGALADHSDAGHGTAARPVPTGLQNRVRRTRDPRDGGAIMHRHRSSLPEATVPVWVTSTYISVCDEALEAWGGEYSQWECLDSIRQWIVPSRHHRCRPGTRSLAPLMCRRCPHTNDDGSSPGTRSQPPPMRRGGASGNSQTYRCSEASSVGRRGDSDPLRFFITLWA